MITQKAHELANNLHDILKFCPHIFHKVFWRKWTNESVLPYKLIIRKGLVSFLSVYTGAY